MSDSPNAGALIDGVESAQALFKDWLSIADPTRENLWVAHVSAEWECIHFAQYVGTQFDVPFPVKEVVLDALRCKAAGIVLAHNHPSGDARPSDHDQRVTRQLAMAVASLGCRVVDHLVLAGETCTSFRKLGLL